MPPLERAGLIGKAVVWEFSARTRNNEIRVKTPYEIDVRWDASSSQVRDQTGKLVRTDATIFLDQQIPIDSIMWQGMYDDLDNPPDNLFIVVSNDYTQDTRGINTERHVNVARYHNVLPPILGTG